ncbi:hypothetical protein BH24ACT5_BH24ACT5_21260 [soil metagenome]
MLGVPDGEARSVVDRLAHDRLLVYGVLDRWRALPRAVDRLLRLAVASTTLFTLVAPRMPALPWSPRTGWNRQKRLASWAA